MSYYFWQLPFCILFFEDLECCWFRFLCIICFGCMNYDLKCMFCEWWWAPPHFVTCDFIKSNLRFLFELVKDSNGARLTTQHRKIWGIRRSFPVQEKHCTYTASICLVNHCCYTMLPSMICYLFLWVWLTSSNFLTEISFYFNEKLSYHSLTK